MAKALEIYLKLLNMLEDVKNYMEDLRELGLADLLEGSQSQQDTPHLANNKGGEVVIPIIEAGEEGEDEVIFGLIGSNL